MENAPRTGPGSQEAWGVKQSGHRGVTSRTPSWVSMALEHTMKLSKQKPQCKHSEWPSWNDSEDLYDSMPVMSQNLAYHCTEQQERERRKAGGWLNIRLSLLLYLLFFQEKNFSILASWILCPITSIKKERASTLAALSITQKYLMGNFWGFWLNKNKPSKHLWDK